MVTPPSAPRAPAMRRDTPSPTTTAHLERNDREEDDLVRALLSQHKSEDTADGPPGQSPVDTDYDGPEIPQAYRNSMPEDRTCACHTSPLASVLCWLTTPLLCAPLCGSCVTVPPRTAIVTTVFGRFWHNYTTPGLYFVNTCGRETTIVSLKTTSVELPAVKVADARGNSIVVSGVVNYRVFDATRAALDVAHLPNFVKVNAHASLKRVASLYPYETNDGTPSLKTEAALLGRALRRALQTKLDCAGIRVVSFELSDLAYAAEVAPMMLVRQQAQALLDARGVIVAGSVGIVDSSLRQLNKKGHPLTDRDEARLVSNLMTVLAGETRPLPTLSLTEYTPDA